MSIRQTQSQTNTNSFSTYTVLIGNSKTILNKEQYHKLITSKRNDDFISECVSLIKK